MKIEPTIIMYSINEIEKLSGIKAHTLRIWEKRYGIITPKRSKSNIRYYLDEDLKEIMNIALLNKNGYKISKIACLDTDEIQTIVAQLVDEDTSFESRLDRLTLSVLNLDEEHFLKIINADINQNGFKNAMLHYVYPLLDKLSMMWIGGSIEPIHEDFVSHLIKRKCLVEIDKLKTEYPVRKKFLLFLPYGEKRELSLLFLHYLIKSNSYQVINLGYNIRVEHIRSACKICDPDYILTIIDEISSPKEYANFINILVHHSGQAKILLSGLQVLKQKYHYPDNVHTFQSSENFGKFLSGIE